MQSVSADARRYDARTIAQVIDLFPAGSPRVAVRSTHIVLGLLLAAVLLARLAWRATRGRQLPTADQGPLHLVAKATHWTLYALLAAALALGVLTTWARGDNIFGLFRLPKLDPADPDLGHWLLGIHGTAVTVLLGLAVVHAGTALLHHYAWKDGVLRRMLPGRSG